MVEGLRLDRQIPAEIITTARKEEHHEPAAHFIQHVSIQRRVSA
jgi:hypothetical protein